MAEIARNKPLGLAIFTGSAYSERVIRRPGALTGKESFFFVFQLFRRFLMQRISPHHRFGNIRAGLIPGKDMTTTNFVESQGPLETLIFKQLGELLHGEKTLAEKYATLQFCDSSENSRFETEVLALNRRADRLQRMMEAMGLGNCTEFEFDRDPLVA